MKKIVYKYLLSPTLLVFVLTTNIFAQTKTALGGSWTNAANWYPPGVPGDGDTILVPEGVTTTIYGNDIELEDAVLIVEGTVRMANDPLTGMANPTIVLSGDESGLIIDNGGKIEDAANSFLGNDNNVYVTVQDEKIWSGASCTSNCATTKGTYTASSPEGSVAWPSTLNNPLPVKLVQFTSDSNNLRWTTANEINCSYFDIEGSSNGTSYMNIGRVNAKKAENMVASYSFTLSNDANLYNYFRLKQVDFDGTSTYYTATIQQKALHQEKVELDIWSVQTGSQIRLMANSSTEDQASIKVYNLEGNPVLNKNILIHEGSNNLEFSELQNLSAGIYILNLTGYHVRAVKKIIIQ